MRVEELRVAGAKVAGSSPVFRSKKSPILLAVAPDGWGFCFADSAVGGEPGGG